jgi:hypothetical protein
MSEILSGLLLGMGFGFVLERAGFGNPNKLTGQFRLTDWSVFKVMFTAIVFAAIGLLIFEKVGLVDAGNLFVPPAYLGAAAIGGALVGAGFAIGGYCPGTSVVGFMSGRIDAAIFLIGLLLGTVLFAGIYPAIESWTTLGEYVKADSLPDAFNISAMSIDVVMVVAAFGVFVLGSWMESKYKRSDSSSLV